MYASLPHFYKAEQLLEGIGSGLHPNKKDHGIEMMLEIVSASHDKCCHWIFYRCILYSNLDNWHTIICCQATPIRLGSETDPRGCDDERHAGSDFPVVLGGRRSTFRQRLYEPNTIYAVFVSSNFRTVSKVKWMKRVFVVVFRVSTPEWLILLLC